MVARPKALPAGPAQAPALSGPAQPIIVIGICTRQRNALLRRLLQSILAQPVPAEYDVRIVVIDNNDHPTAHGAMTNLPGRFPIEIVHEPRAGLVHARNRALKAAIGHRAVWFIGVDDDEWVAADWLEQFIRGFQASGPAIVIGTSRYVYHNDLSPFLTPRQMPRIRAGKEPGILGCGNYALHRDLFDPSEGIGLRFEMAYNESGGEDYDFMLRAKRVHDWPLYGWPAAVAFEDYKGERATLRYRLTRAIRTQTLMHQVARAHRRAGYHGGTLRNALRFVLRINRHFVYGVCGLVGGTALFAANRHRGRHMIGDALERCASVWAAIPFLIGRRPTAYGAKVKAK